MDKIIILEALAALGQETRLDIYRLLAKQGESGLPAGDIATQLGLVQNTASNHLKILGDAGLVLATREGRTIRHAIAPEQMRAVINFLTAECCNGNPSACGFAPTLTNLERTIMQNHKTYNVLFLCTGNSARSILAEAILNDIGAPRFKGWSAGSQPKGEVHPYSLDLLKQLGHPVGELRSKSWDEFSLAGAPEFDFIFTVCDNAANEACPVWLGHPATAHWGIPDPAAVNGSEAEKHLAFAEAYRQMKNRISAFIALPIASLDKIAMKTHLDDIGRMQD
jgi:ArsR family transcriptional regulator, arsenate/arsenite/antimonite-responsive transcriptional repressor / arsenate reductase (thioredoxin)